MRVRICLRIKRCLSKRILLKRWEKGGKKGGTGDGEGKKGDGEKKGKEHYGAVSYCVAGARMGGTIFTSWIP